MAVLIVVDTPRQWPIEIPGGEVVSARDYLTERRFVELRRAKVFNLCRSYGYQSVGYYVSLLAAARGHKPLPSVTTIQDIRHSAVVRIVSADLERLLQRILAPIRAQRFELSIYFGRNMASRYDRLCQALFEYFPVPLLRAEFVHVDQWRLHSLRPIAGGDIPPAHHAFVVEQAQRFFARPGHSDPRAPRFQLAMLVDPDEVDAPSDPRALDRFVRAGKRLNIGVELITREDFGRVAEFDALFIRQTTAVNHYTYRFASRAEAEGLVVIDDPESIVRCTNKVYQAELFDRHQIPCPKTMVVHRDNAKQIDSALGFPCVLKRPDSSFSAGVVKAADRDELDRHLEVLFDRSELVVAQEYLPSDFDWRVGVLDGRALYVCKYYMARGHWQIQKAAAGNERVRGRSETLAVEHSPPDVVALAVRAAGLIGRGLYGVDLKSVGGRLVVMEINDNPSIESGGEDAVLKDDLYLAVMRSFYTRLEQRGREPGRG